ncbi:lysylphosphatidylglycerol synthase domain-containing protein [Methylobacterium sp. Leaf118]|uniref:lysylphosphatidylglycerol synthase domain-containing protein n=1 Tax=Methylobacterium sp. Leaf118 TaxID=2876562 RepID=UPI001E4E9244|nr:lysylphosphatidylglycerol synthase domain-containing protein [Methylobacterium sp. Leaf118]
MNFAGKHRAVTDARPDEAAPEGEPGKGSSRRGPYAWLGTLASVVLILASLGVLWKLSEEITWAELQKAFTGASSGQLVEAFGFVALSYLFLTCYDALALRQLRLKVPYRITALASFTSYAVSFTLGFPLLTAATIRYWIYSRRGLSAAKIAALTVIAGFTFWLGMGVVLGLSLIIEAGQLASLTFKSIGVNSSVRLNQILGFGALASVLAYLAWVSVKRRYIKVRHWQLELPGATVSFSQMLVGIGDVCAAAAVLYLLMPADMTLGFTTFLAIYVLAAMLGIASNAPGGIGVFEATILIALSYLPREEVLGSLLLFRACYYLVPFLLALLMLGVYEGLMRLRRHQAANDP